MISIKECRRILMENGYEKLDELTDEKLGEIRNLLYQWAELQMENEERLSRRCAMSNE